MGRPPWRDKARELVGVTAMDPIFSVMGLHVNPAATAPHTEACSSRWLNGTAWGQLHGDSLVET